MKVLIANSYYSDMPKELQREIYNAGFTDGKHSKTSNNHDVLVKRAKMLSSDTERFVFDGTIVEALRILSNHVYMKSCIKIGKYD